MRIAVIGAGAVGLYFGARLARGGSDVRVLVRGESLDAIRERGIRVRSAGDDFTAMVTAAADPAELGPCDAILVCVKTYDTEAAAKALPPLLHRETAVVSLQNGIDNAQRLGVPGHVLGGAAFVFAERVAPGVVEHRGGPGTIAFGELDGRVTGRAEQLLAACRAAGIAERLEPDVRRLLWQKYAFICAQAGMTAAARRPLGEIRDDPEAWTMYRRIVAEVAALAAVEADVAVNVEEILDFAQALPAGSYSSLHDDLVAGRALELEALHGTAVRLGRERAVSMPACEAVYALLHPSLGSRS
jgi:2-dehydropantoate 2-reductase